MWYLCGNGQFCLDSSYDEIGNREMLLDLPTVSITTPRPNVDTEMELITDSEVLSGKIRTGRPMILIAFYDKHGSGIEVDMRATLKNGTGDEVAPSFVYVEEKKYYVFAGPNRVVEKSRVLQAVYGIEGMPAGSYTVSAEKEGFAKKNVEVPISDRPIWIDVQLQEVGEDERRPRLRRPAIDS